MTVKQLIKKLVEMPMDAEVVIDSKINGDNVPNSNFDVYDYTAEGEPVVIYNIIDK